MESADRRRLSPEDNNFKRRMKTPMQLETLERVFADDRYPSESVRADLSTLLNLTDKQLQMWFCHRRLKDRKEKDEDSPSAGVANANVNSNNVSRKKARTEKQSQSQYVVLASEPAADVAMVSGGGQYAEEYLYENAERFTPEEPKPRSRRPGPRESTAFPGKRRNQALASKVAKAEAAAIAAVEAQLGEPLREDGPPLGVEFDPLPPGAFSTNVAAEEMPAEPKPAVEPEPFPTERMYEITELQNNRVPGQSAPLAMHPIHNSAGSKRKSMGPPSTPHPHSIQYEPRPSVREYQFLSEQPEPQRMEETHFFERPTPLDLFPNPDRTLELLQQSRIAQAEEARMQKEMELHEKRLRKDYEKQEVTRRKREEQIRKEQDRLELQRKREDERIRRDRMKEQERIEREQKKEAERLEKESKRMEKQRRREETRKEKQAAKMKAANERALAKRLAKEMTDLMDDEELERMEAAAAASSLNLAFFAPFSKNGMDTSQVELKAFPPPTVRMKPVVAIQPWSNSDLNVGNLLLAWRFLTTFADVVGLWPFTLDELVQAFHDYDSRLLGEIHVALLRTLVRDIEEAAQAVSGGMVGQRDAIAMAAGGHPQLVEAAFAWGFDIREWGKHVNPLTWPEILRQFALAAGFGPKWKTRKITTPDRPKETTTEGEDGEDIVANLRSGAAAAHAVASMQGRGMGHLRRSQYRLTPGTVKYAAFHVLSLAGEKGLNIVEVADRIQTSGLRDLSSSRTPEASIAAALSRDTVLFERTAPSTYCVRAQFRKDSEDADEILSAARERIRNFRSDLADEEEADKDGDEADREEYESEGQDTDDVEEMEEDLEEGVSDPTEKKVVSKTEDVKADSDSKESVMVSQQKNSPGPGTRKGGSKSNVVGVSAKKEEEDDEDDEEEEEDEEDEDHALVKGDNLQEDQKAEIQLDEETEIDESQVGEPWVQGLVEGEYADLSVEERLNALVALVTVVNEGNAIRIALEERLEAATALKRQMWAEMQLEKRRHKEELLSRTHAPLVKTDGESPDPENMASEALTLYDQGPLDMNVPNSDGAGLGEAFIGNGKSFAGLSNGLVAHEAGSSLGGSGNHLAEKSRAQAKADIGLRAEELYVFRSQPLGSDRRHNRYWQFVTGNGGQDPGCGRVFFESSSDGFWGVVDTEEAFDALLASLDPRGAREAALTAILNRLEGTLRQGMKLKSSGTVHSSPSLDKRSALRGMEESPVSSFSGSDSDTPEVVGAIAVELGRSSREQKQALDRYKATEKWIWAECSTGGSVPKATRTSSRREARVLAVCDLCHDLYANKDKHCLYCHATFDKSSSPRPFSEHNKDCEEKKRRGDPNWKLQGPVVSMPSRLQFLKIELVKIESAVPAKALKKDWNDQQRKTWAASLKSASEPNQVLQAVTTLESMIERDWLSSTYETTEEIASAAAGAGHFGGQGAVLPFWVPPTTAAVALRIRLLDNAVAYSQEAKEEREKQEIEDEINQKNSKMSTFRFTPEGLPGDQDDDQPAETVETVPSASGKGRSRVRSSGGGKTRAGKGNGQGVAAQAGGRRKSTTATVTTGGGSSKSRVRPSGSAAKKAGGGGLKRKLQFREGAEEADAKQVWGGAAKGRSARAAGRGGKAAPARRPSRAPAGPRARARRQAGARRPGQKQRNTNELMVPSKKSKATAVVVKAGVDEDDEVEDESNGGDSQAGYADEGFDDGDQFDAEENHDEPNGSDPGERDDEVDEEQAEEDEEQAGEDEEQAGEDEEPAEEDEDGEEADEEELEDDDADADVEGQEDDGYGVRSGYARDDADEVEEEEDEAGGEETEDEDDPEKERQQSYSDED